MRDRGKGNFNRRHHCVWDAAVKLTGTLHVHLKHTHPRVRQDPDYRGVWHNMTSFNLFSDQKGTLVVTPKSATGAVKPGSNFRITTPPADSTVVIVTTNPGFPDQFPVTCQGAGTATVGISFDNAEGNTFETVFTFNVAAAPTDPAVTLDGELQNVGPK